MRTHLIFLTRLGVAVCLVACAPAMASAASSFSNTLTGFTGDSTVPATQAALNTAGFNFASTDGLNSEFTSDPSVVFNSSGANFGNLFGGDGGRNYMRTTATDFATVSFVAEISVVYGLGSVYTNQQAFFGMGTGDIALFGVADWSTQFASTWVQPEDSGSNPLFTTFRTNNDANQFVNHPAPGHGDGTHRIQMTFDGTARTMIYAIDFNYAGGSFTADITAPTVDLNHVDCPSGCGDGSPLSADFFGPDGWPTEASSIYFGGDDFVIFKDFSVVVTEEPGQDGDFDDDGDVDGYDFLSWQRGVSPNPFSAGDLTLWQTNYGAGGLAAISNVPEPASVFLLIFGAVAAASKRARR